MCFFVFLVIEKDRNRRDITNAFLTYPIEDRERERSEEIEVERERG